MSSLLAVIRLNLTNITYELPRMAVTPYTNIFGDLFFGIFFGFIGVSIYAAGSGDSRIYLVLIAYLVAVGLIFSVVLHFAVIAIFGLLLAFLITTVLYKVFVESRT